jgi:hypothetical protein
MESLLTTIYLAIITGAVLATLLIATQIAIFVYLQKIEPGTKTKKKSSSKNNFFLGGKLMDTVKNFSIF